VHFNTQKLELSPYQTTTKKITFYFPENGQFKHYPSNISNVISIIARSDVRVLDVSLKKKKAVEGSFKADIALFKT
jgi:hypothetical protein